ncbi:MAG: nickel pincer cofactor biosynthesis protein LarC [Bacteroidetes bacterium]|nr:nickel pincer cofactor biosynthesis protein LarC [Bacteroidota bacterium]
MKTLYYDCFSGISGDMHLGAMIDMGVPAEYIKKELSKLKIDEEFDLRIYTAQKMGITGTKVDVVLKGHDHEIHDAPEEHSSHPHHHEHRSFTDISSIIKAGGYSGKVETLAIAIFRKVAEAESKVHGVGIDEVHFHEVGATDAIVDIVGAALCIDYLKVDRIIASPVQVGGGFVECAHGTFPVPAPATTEILKNIPCKFGAVNRETTTPTGAAILAASVDEFTSSPEMVPEKISYGLGTKDFPIPNVLRLVLGTTEPEESEGKENLLIECNLDDMTGEDLGYLMNRLFDAGALDVFYTPIQMKKNRPAVKLSVLCLPRLKETISGTLFNYSGTFGIRVSRVEKVMMERTTKQVPTKWGNVRLKEGVLPSGEVTRKVEYEDLARIADTEGVSPARIRNAVMGAVEKEKHDA